MHESRPLDDIIEVNEKMGTNPPDRQRFENDLEEFHVEMQKIRSQIQMKCKKCTDSNPIENEMRTQREQLRVELVELKRGGDKIKLDIDAQRRKQLDLEKDCRIRNKDVLEKLLSENEDRYKLSLSARDEQALVTEIDALKRNKKQLESLAEITSGRKAMDIELEKNRNKKHKVYIDLTNLQNKFKMMKQNRRMIEDEIRDLKHQLQGANERKKDLINAYDNNREEYKTWLNANKMNGNSVPLSFPSARKMKAPIDVEELEPYYEQKRDCNRLIHYLERLQTTLQKDEPVKTSAPPTLQLIDDDDDSADELPPQLIKHNAKITVAPAPVVKKSFKKPTQPISHNIDIYKLFGTVDVDVPKTYADVGASLKAVREKLDFYNQQTTNELDWGEELNGMEFLSVSRTASDMDSFMDDSISDIGSVSSFYRASSRTSCPSPLATDASPKRWIAQTSPTEAKHTPV
ncbi:hypothetical protein L5515_019307 [Caenorhabditis briggsae]|uniref:Uncharacterized protein n=1 Tax=Caenorhabditis briggsae TaxID=6238 RepID=A0AAE9FLF1_CAEBR|nr:hypothetical protein L5515_019307 [Caenorhabditis briggsae]